MQRDMDLARAILLALEECDKAWELQDLQIDGATPEQVSYHVKLLHQAGLIEAHDVSTMNSFKWFPMSLTWQGHEFLDASRDETRWNKAKKLTLEKGGGLIFDVLKDVLVQLAKQGLSS